jgi:hypothetical protein
MAVNAGGRLWESRSDFQGAVGTFSASGAGSVHGLSRRRYPSAGGAIALAANIAI